MTNSQIYWQRYETAATISVLNPNITGVRIDAVPVFCGKEYADLAIHTTFSPEHKYMGKIKCPNNDCDCGYIEISDEIFKAVKSEEIVEGTKQCGGHLKKYSHNKSSCFDCEVYVKYKITPEVI